MRASSKRRPEMATFAPATAGQCASLMFVLPTDLTGTGLGAVNTVLTIQSPGNTNVATGCVGYNGSGDTFLSDVCAFADAKCEASCVAVQYSVDLRHRRE